MSIDKYPNYKTTGLEWLEMIPSHWEVKRLKHFCKVYPSNVDKKTVESETPVRLCNYTDVYYNEFIVENHEFMAASATEEQIVKFGLKEGDTIITKDSESADDIAIAAYVPQDLPGVICGYHLSMLRPKEAIHGAFVKRLFDSIYVKSLMATRANGLTRVGLSQYAIDNVDLPLPPKQEQVSIATFLDHETAKIDDLIAEQERLIQRLQEKRQAVISHAVTKGLNPDAPTKDSGVEWLGQIPEHWTCKKIKHTARMESGHTPDRKVEAYWENCEIPWVSLNDTGFLKDNDYITDTAYFINELGIQNSSARLLPERVVVFSRDATIGRCAITTRPMAVSQHFIAWVCGEEVSPEYLLLRLKSMTQELERLTCGATLKTIGMPDIKTLVTPVPPKHEQEKIVEHVQTRLTVIDELIENSKKAIELLRERRSALISAAVTGQIDVRGLNPEEEAV